MERVMPSHHENLQNMELLGASISPILANRYLHYALDLWFEIAVKRTCRGESRMIRYADDYVCCFQYKDDAEHFHTALIKRLFQI